MTEYSKNFKCGCSIDIAANYNWMDGITEIEENYVTECHNEETFNALFQLLERELSSLEKRKSYARKVDISTVELILKTIKEIIE